MKLLLDSCLSNNVAERLRSFGHDVLWAGDWSPDPGDEEILRRAISEARVMVTLDRDYGELMIVLKLNQVSLIRLIGFRSGEQAAAIDTLLVAHQTDLAAGAILTLEPWRIRIRKF